MRIQDDENQARKLFAAYVDAPLVGTEMVGSVLKSGWSPEMLKVWRRAVRKDAYYPYSRRRSNAGKFTYIRFEKVGSSVVQGYEALLLSYKSFQKMTKKECTAMR